MGRDIHTVAISHGEGRFVAPEALLDQLVAGGQVAAQYVDEAGVPSMDLSVNPNGSMRAIECITSPDGRVLGKMGHSERSGAGLYKNVPAICTSRCSRAAWRTSRNKRGCLTIGVFGKLAQARIGAVMSTSCDVGRQVVRCRRAATSSENKT